jgi:hypothetical protein
MTMVKGEVEIYLKRSTCWPRCLGRSLSTTTRLSLLLTLHRCSTCAQGEGGS